jgi:hypothetical protein
MSSRTSTILTEGFVFPSIPPGICRDTTLKLGHDRFLSNPFQFIIHTSPSHSMLLSWLLIKVKQSLYTPWRRLGGEEL